MITTILGFPSYSIVQEYLSEILIENEGDYTKFERNFNGFLLQNFTIFI
jgi:hypothetical protein